MGLLENQLTTGFPPFRKDRPMERKRHEQPFVGAASIGSDRPKAVSLHRDGAALKGEKRRSRRHLHAIRGCWCYCDVTGQKLLMC